jgi:hypothetical protein
MVRPRIWHFKWDFIENRPCSKFKNLKLRFVVASGGVYIFKTGIVTIGLPNSRLSCISHGIAVSWQDSDADCREPLIVNDDQLTPDLAEKRHIYPSGTNAPFCGMTIFFCQMNLCKILTHVIQIAFGLKPTNYSKILKLDDEVEAFRRNILPNVLNPDSPEFDINFESVSIIMRCFYLKAILLLHRPFIGRSQEHPQFRRSRERAVQAALQIVRNSIDLFTSGNPLLENHFAAYPMLAQGLFPAPVALALDLYTYPDQPNPEITRQALLDMRRLYFQLSPKFVPLKRLYKIINILMGKAWEKAGLTVPIEEMSTPMGSFSSQSTPSPTMGNYDKSRNWGFQGVVPTSLQQFLPTDPHTNGNFSIDWSAQHGMGQGASKPLRAASTPLMWDGSNVNSLPLFGSDTSLSNYSATPQFTEGIDMENNIIWVCSILFLG